MDSSSNLTPPSAQRCLEIIAATESDLAKPSLKQAASFAKDLFGCLPYLERRDIDLTIFLKKVVLIFEAHSTAAAVSILDPVTGLVGREEFISLPKINLALQAFEDEKRSIILSAQMLLTNHQQRKLERRQAQFNTVESQSFEARHGVSPIEFVKAKLQ
jgi:hypothetical protein